MPYADLEVQKAYFREYERTKRTRTDESLAERRLCSAQWRKNNPLKVKANNARHVAAVRAGTKRITDVNRIRLATLKEGHGCKVCGESDYRCLSFHHRDSSTKFKEVSRMLCYSWKKIQDEIDKCDVLCENCHRKLHAERCIP